MKKRIIALLLCVMMIFGMLANGAINVSDMKVSVYHNGNPATSVILPKGSEIELNAVNAVTGSASYQWQINVYGDLWVDISGATGLDLRVSYAMVASLLQGGAAKLRVEATAGETVAYSDAITVTVSEEDPNAAVAIPELDEDTYQVLPAPVASVYEVTPPSASPEVEETPAEEDVISSAEPSVQPTTEPTVEPSVQPTTEPTVEPSVQPTTEPSAEPQTVEPEEETVEPSVEPSTAPVEETGLITTKTATVPQMDAENEADLVDAEDNTANIIINYQFTDGQTAAESYTANIAKGSDFYAVVPNPSVTGYLPYEGEATETTDSVTLNYSNVQEDKVVTVTYKPTTVNYTIVYKLQNVDGTGYVEDSRETKSGLTESIVPAVDKKFPGFEMLWYDTPAIAADGSTIVEVYYNRTFYLMMFELDGGYGVEPIYARYGSAISVGTPTKPGYTFTGWSPVVPATMPVDGGTYTAQWTANDTAKVTLVFWGENADDEGYSYAKSGTLELKPGTEYTFTEGTSVFLICGMEEHEHDSACSLICGKTEHTVHTNDCYGCGHVCDLTCYSTTYNFVETTKPDELNQLITPIQNGIYTYETSSYRWDTTHYYLYLDGKWYCGSNLRGNASDTQEITLNCDHTHTADCYTCEMHSHTSACYSCGYEEHTHTNSCNQTVSDIMDSNLWTFAKSDTATVAADGSTIINVYYDRTTFTMTFKYSNQTLGTVTDKWGANILDEFNAMCDLAREKTSRYSGWGDSTTGHYVDYIAIMPQTDKTLTVNTSNSSSTSTMTYYVEDLNGNDTELFKIQFAGSYNVTEDEYYEIRGFTIDKSRSTSTGRDCNGAKFYYTRNSYNIVFNDGYNDVKSETVKYEAPLSVYSSYVPEVPSAYEPGSVTFGGWYLNPECTGDQFTLGNHTMPSDNILLYAKWVPVNHNVNIYLTDDRNPDEQIGETLIVPHGSKVAEEDIPAEPTNGNLKFIGWFYMDGDVEKAFDFNNMPVKKNLDIYAKWSDTTVVPYFVYYRAKDSSGNVINDENGLPVELADPTTGQALTNISRTFDAKPGEELIEGYKEGYFPETKSHTMVLKAGADNTFIFYYVPVDAVPYTVRYLHTDGTPMEVDADGNEVVKYVENNRKAVVTETFKVYPGYMPDAYQKRLVVSADGVGNEIIFYYEVDNEHAYYQLSHWIENIDGGTYTEYGTATQAKGDVGTVYSAQPQNIPGFTYVESKTEIVVGGNTTLGTSAELTTSGLEIRHYYDRIDYPYEVHYLEQGTDKVLAEPKTGMTGAYGDVVAENKIDIPGYVCVSPETQTLTIRIVTDTVKNIITFYYKEADVTINYVADPAAGGTVDLNDEKANPVASDSETVKALNGDAVGATAAAKDGYKFVGWYDANGNQVGTDASFVPKKVDGLNVAATYTAKFEFAEYPYTIKYLEKDTNKVLAEEVSGVAKYTSTITGEQKTITGYTFDSVSPSVSITIGTGTNEIIFYYTENEVTVKYIAVTKNYNENAAESTVGGVTDPTYNLISVITGQPSGSEAKANSGYSFKGWFTDAACTIAADATVANVNGNEIKPVKVNGQYVEDTFYALFEEDSVTINYQAVGPEGATNFGTVTNPSDNNATGTTGTETVGVVTDTAAGSTAAAANGFKFVGWYSDEACTQQVSTNAKYEPAKVDGKNVAATCYAKFEWDVANLEVVKAGTDLGSQKFIFHINGTANDGTVVDMDVVITGAGSVLIKDLPVGTYTVAEDTSWSWRYTCDNASQTVTVQGGQDNKVTFNNELTNNKWLNYYTNIVNTLPGGNS